MTAEKQEKRKVLVGMRLDSQSRELLIWAIVKVAYAGDHVVAVHVCRSSEDASKVKLLLDGYLEIFRGLCDVKKVDLTGHILAGNSIRKSIVREAKSCAAVAVVLGMNKQAAFGSWMSLAKYCAKHLPPTTEVLTIHNGKIVRRSSSNDQIPGLGGDPRPSYHKFVKQSSAICENCSEFCDSEASDIDTHGPQLAQGSEEGTRGGFGAVESMEDDSSPIPINKQAHSGAASLYLDNMLEQRPGWPLLRKTSLPTQCALAARKMSVVQWVMSLPNRSLPESPQGSGDSSSNKSESPIGREFSDDVHSRRNSLSIWSELPEEMALPFEMNSLDFTWFSYEVLKSSTSQFSSENLIGKGGCSRVYKGLFPDGKPVAVKVTKSSKEIWKDFSLEINIITSLRHKNMIPLIGVCIENDLLISVYEFMSKGSLEQNLHGNSKAKAVLPWETRFEIAIGVAEALNYLHNGCSRPIIHRDVKSSNILLSDGFEPKLSDFGLAIYGPISSSFQNYSDVVGTFGYLAPEYFMYGKVSDKIDVYSFGVVLLELLSGRKPIGFDSSQGQESLVMWAKPILECGNLRGILDPDLEGDHDESQMQRMILAATLCLTRAARFRPNMRQVLKLLEGEEPVEKWINSYVDKQEDKDKLDVNDDEVNADTTTKRHVNSTYLDVDYDFTSCSSMEQVSSPSLEEYLKGRWSRSPSFD
ncbi:hypothetical protein Nepgr_004798 [Nepenthes gracilis]|uniref:Protein kinase domain-containing protein n=1 Tax=Nepenthes gracilis TaxID=150966 RepID=A0AAD3S260_NEPGR|nr:hypothetical protein Nepgr_004798 [Nepenthes gracilis]